MGHADVYDRWLAGQDYPVYGGFYIEDALDLELGWDPLRECPSATLDLEGQEGVCEIRVTEIPPGESRKPFKFALDELVYVLDGHGTARVWDEAGVEKTFEWQPRSLFVLPRHAKYELHSVEGDKPARLAHYNYLPLALSLMPDPEWFFNPSGVPSPFGKSGRELYGQPTPRVPTDGPENQRQTVWSGDFFPDLYAWDRIDPMSHRGAGGHVLRMNFPETCFVGHMSVFPSGRYKKAHYHGPGYLLIIPGGQGFSLMWREGEEKVVVPWRERSIFVPPNLWFHQHFNSGEVPARYLALHPPKQFKWRDQHSEAALARRQVEYHNEEPWIREKFEAELAKNNLVTQMPEEVYTNPNFSWK